MNVKNPERVLVRGINSDWFEENFKHFWIGFKGNPQAVPKEDAYYIGLYLESPISKITHIGIVDRIDRYEDGADFYLKALIKLKENEPTGHAIRKHENWKLSDFGLTLEVMENLRKQLDSLSI